MKQSIAITAAFVCLAVANNVHETRSNFSSWKLFTWRDLISSPAAIEVITELEQKCSPAINVQEAVKKMEKCLEPITAIIYEVNSDIDEVKYKDDIAVAYKKYCNNVHLSNNCFPTFAATLAPCFKNQENATLTTLNNLVSTVTSYKCQNDRFIEYFKNDGENCYINKTKSMKTCIDPHLTKFEGTICSILAVKANERLCKFIVDARTCVVTELKKCENQAAADFYGPLYDVILYETCTKYNEMQAASLDYQNASVSLQSKRMVLFLFGILGITFGHIIRH